MGRFISVLLGLSLLAGAVGVFGYRLSNDPGALERYSWIAGENTAEQREQDGPAAGPQSMRRQDNDSMMAPNAAPGDDAAQSRRRPDGRSRKEQLDNMKMLELGLDFANVLVGLIGIYLAFGGMRSRRRV